MLYSKRTLSLLFLFIFSLVNLKCKVATGEDIAQGNVKQKFTKGTPAVRVVKAANSLINSIKRTVYSFNNYVNEKTGYYKIDCSGLALFLALESIPEHCKPIIAYTNFARKSKKKRPRAKEFYEFLARISGADKFNDGSLWSTSNFLEGVKPGAFLVYSFSPNVMAQRIKDGKSTGHIVIVSKLPEFLRNKIVEVKGNKIKAKEYLVEVIESSPFEKIDDTKTSGKYIAGIKPSANKKGVLNWIKSHFESRGKLGVGRCKIIIGVDRSGKLVYTRMTETRRPKIRYKIITGYPI